MPGSGGALASRQRAKGHPRIIIQVSEDTRRHQKKGQHRGRRGSSTQARRTREPDTRDAKRLRNNRGAGWKVEGGRRGEQMGAMKSERWIRIRENPLGPIETLATLREAKGVTNRRGQRRK